MSRWYFQPIFDSYLLVALLVGGLASLLLLVPRFGRLGRGQRGALIALRGLVIVLVILAMLQPTHVSTQSRPQASTLIVLLDGSRSMSIADTARGQTRWQAQRDALDAAMPAVRQLSRDMEVQAYWFDDHAHPVSLDEEPLPLSAEPDGEQSDIGTSLDDVLRNAAGKRLAGVILMSDGAQHALNPRVDIQQPARELARLGYPLYCVPFGLPREQTQARDVAIENLPDQYTVFVKNELEIHAVLQVRGYAGQAIPVRLLIELPGGGQETRGPVPVEPRADGQPRDVQFVYTPNKAGQYKLTVQAARQPGELVTENNQLSAFLTVLEGGLRVLYLYGSIVSGQRLDCQSIDTSPDIQLDHQWVDSRRRGQWPLSLSQPLSSGVYDVFLLGDLDSAALGQANCRALADAVDRGNGLMMLGGYHSFGPGGYRDTALAAVLPVVMGQFERQQFGEPRRADVHLNRPLEILPTFPHFITHLQSGARNKAAWQRLPPIFGANKFLRIKESNTRVLAQSATGDPILVAGVYGQGRVLALAVDSLATWYRHGFKSEHKRFWRQAILWLGQKEDAVGQGVWIKLDQRRFNPGAQVVFSAGANGPDGQPLADVTFEAKVTGPQAVAKPARLSPDGSRWSGTFQPEAGPGDYRIEVVGRQGQEAIGSAQRRFMVLDRDLELSDPAANPQQLQQLARLTADAGGKSLAPEQLPALLSHIQRQPQKMEIDVQSKWQLADTALDAWLFFLAVVGLLSVEWFLRKRWRLV